MVLFLNFLPWIIALVGIYVFYRSIKAKKNAPTKAALTAVATLLILIMVNAATPSYFPKGTVSGAPLAIPEFVPSDAKIENRLLSPKSDAVQEEKFEGQFDWEATVEQNKEELSQ